MKFLNIRLTRQAKRKLWLILPYRLRLRIEHLSYVASLLTNHWSHLDVKFLPRLKRLWYRKLARLYPEIIKLNNPYVPIINAPVTDKEAAARINNFLSRFNA